MLAGKFLAVLPAHADVRAQPGFFSNRPQRHSAPAAAQLAHRRWP